MMTRIMAAAVQMNAVLGAVEQNMEKAEELIARAASSGARLIALPECCITGYSLTMAMLDAVQPEMGRLEGWLSGLSRRHGAFIGIGSVEASGNDFYNSYLLAGPDGRILGRTRKIQTEFFLFKPGTIDDHVVDTDIGRIGVGICADNHRSFFARAMMERDVDLLLMPHATPVPYRTSRFIKEKDIADAREHAGGIAPLLSGLLGVPAVFANQTGAMHPAKWWGVMGRFIDAEHFSYPGLSAIVDSDRRVIARLGEGEGVASGELRLDPARKRVAKVPSHSGWIFTGSFVMRRIVMPMEIARGKAAYRKGAAIRAKGLH